MTDTKSKQVLQQVNAIETSGRFAALTAANNNAAGGSSRANDIVEIVVLTPDEFFLETLRAALGSATRLWHVPSAEKAADLLIAGSVGIMVLDVAGLQTGTADFIAQIRRQFPELVLLVAGMREDESGIAPLVSSGQVYRFMHLPLSEARARSFVQAAVKKYAELRESRSRARIAPRVRATQSAPWKMGLIVCGAALATGAAVTVWRHRSTPPIEVPSTVPSSQDALLSSAAQALAANRLSEPRGDNALELYLAAIASRPADARARAGLAEVHERLLARAENALIEERLDEAQSAIETARLAGVEKGRIAFLSVQLTKARELAKSARARERVQPEAAGAQADAVQTDAVQTGDGAPKRQSAAELSKQTEALLAARAALTAERNRLQVDNRDRLLRLANDRLQQDRLIAPANDNAKYYLGLLRQTDASYAPVGAAAQDLASRLTSKARRALELGQLDAAKTWLEEAAFTGVSSAEWTQTKADLDAATRSPAKTEITGQRTPPASSAVVAGTQTGTVQAGAVQVIPPKPISAPKPDYPEAAFRKKIEGWVDLEFTVTTNGNLKNISIAQSMPSGVFDAATRDTAAKWRFSPARQNGVAVEQRAHMRVRFNLGNE